MTERIELKTSVYLLPLRHPVPVALQVAQLDQLSMGRFVLGVGVGGEDPHEFTSSGVDPHTRGARTGRIARNPAAAVARGRCHVRGPALPAGPRVGATAQTGDTFHATLDSPVAIDGDVVIPAHYDVEGHIIAAQSSGKFAGQALLELQLDRIKVGDRWYNVQTDHFKQQTGSRGKNTAEKVGGGAIAGAILGGILGGGKRRSDRISSWRGSWRRSPGSKQEA